MLVVVLALAQELDLPVEQALGLEEQSELAEVVFANLLHHLVELLVE